MGNSSKEKHLSGIPVSNGVAHGRLCVISQHQPQYLQLSSLPRAYSRYLESALQSSNKELVNLVGQCSSVGQDMFEALFAHNLIMSDQSLQKWIGLNLLENSDDLETAINTYLESYRELLLSCLEQNLEEQHRLFKDLRQSLLRLLGNHRSHTYCGETMGCEIGECAKQNMHIKYCQELSALSAIMLDDQTCGVLVENESVDLDASILLRGLNIPVVSGVHAGEISPQFYVLINGNDGRVIINPKQATLNSLLPAD